MVPLIAALLWVLIPFRYFTFVVHPLYTVFAMSANWAILELVMPTPNKVLQIAVSAGIAALGLAAHWGLSGVDQMAWHLFSQGPGFLLFIGVYALYFAMLRRGRAAGDGADGGGGERAKVHPQRFYRLPSSHSVASTESQLTSLPSTPPTLELKPNIEGGQRSKADTAAVAISTMTTPIPTPIPATPTPTPPTPPTATFVTLRQVILLLFLYLVSLCYAQLFSLFFLRYASSGAVQVLLSFLFGFPLAVIAGLQKKLSEQIDRQCQKYSLRPVATFSLEIVREVFNKFLFTGITSWGVFAAWQGVGLATQYYQFVLRLSPTWWGIRGRMRGWVGRRTTAPGKLLGHTFLALIGESSRLDQESFKREVVSDFFAACMAQRIAACALPILIVTWRFLWNKDLFGYSERALPAPAYTFLWQLVLAQFIVEWFTSTVLHLSILYKHKMDSFKIGGAVMCANSSIQCLIVIAARVIMDIIVFEGAKQRTL
jgi:hypothetical protein